MENDPVDISTHFLFISIYYEEFSSAFYCPMIIKRSKSFFSAKAKQIALGLLFLVLFFFLFSLKNQPEWPGIIGTAVVILVLLVILTSKDEFTLNEENLLLRNYWKVFGMRLFSEDKQLPGRIKRVMVLRRKRKWKRYLALAIPFTTEIEVYEVFIIDWKGRPRRIFSQTQDNAEEYAEILRTTYREKERASHGI